MSSVLDTYARKAISFTEGKGSYLFTENGDKYLDFVQGIATNILGHCHEHLVNEIQAQSKKLWHVSNAFIIPEQERLAKRLTDNTFADFVCFQNSGTEATEASIKIARKYFHKIGKPEKNRIITFQGAFHGRTLAALFAANNPKHTEGFGPKVDGFDQVPFADHEAVKKAINKNTAATASILFVPPAFAADSAMEAADAGIKTCVAITDGIPSHDMIKIKRYMRRYSKTEKMTLIGPNCAGVISPGKTMLGIMPGHIYKEGRVGIIGRSGTLGYEAAQQLKNLNIGVSTSVGIGGDPINGSSFKDILEKFEQDNETDAVLMIGEIGGPQEVAAGKFAKENMKKPVIAYIAGLTAPKGRVMGHAGAIVSAYGESAVEKVELLKECGVTISNNPSVMGETVKSALNGKKN